MFNAGEINMILMFLIDKPAFVKCLTDAFSTYRNCTLNIIYLPCSELQKCEIIWNKFYPYCVKELYYIFSFV